jgi:hypothetical protein
MNATKNRKPTTRKYSEAEIEARKAERAIKVAALEAAAESFELDEDDRGMMRAYESLMEHYSEGNALLILAQASDQNLRIKRLTDVGAYGAFQAAGRQVKKGEHASIFIWAPAGTAKAADKTEDVPVKPGEDKKAARKFWRIAGLFHISQTEKIQSEAVQS